MKTMKTWQECFFMYVLTVALVEFGPCNIKQPKKWKADGSATICFIYFLIVEYYSLVE